MPTLSFCNVLFSLAISFFPDFFLPPVLALWFLQPLSGCQRPHSFHSDSAPPAVVEAFSPCTPPPSSSSWTVFQPPAACQTTGTSEDQPEQRDQWHDNSATCSTFTLIFSLCSTSLLLESPERSLPSLHLLFLSSSQLLLCTSNTSGSQTSHSSAWICRRVSFCSNQTQQPALCPRVRYRSRRRRRIIFGFTVFVYWCFSILAAQWQSEWRSVRCQAPLSQSDLSPHILHVKKLRTELPCNAAWPLTPSFPLSPTILILVTH